MTSPKYATTTESGRTYCVPGFSQQMDSVTSILHVLNAPAITNAAARRAAECAVNEEAVWHAIQQEQGTDAAIGYIKEAAKRHMHSRGDIGTAVHHACEDYILGKGTVAEVSIAAARMATNNGVVVEAEEIKKYVEAYVRFIEKYQPEFVAVEQTVFHPEIGYAGTADMIVRLGDKTYIGDLKTGFVGEKAALQMCAYAHATHHVKGNASEPVPWVIDGAFVIDLKPGKFSVRFCDISSSTWRSFQAAVELSRFDRRRDVFGAKWK